ncbi:MAG: hypothetical protein CL607_08060 [Anaerolineaceae bacterium]|nr:hypothetical protein [Anaerolineaceae bacterium]
MFNRINKLTRNESGQTALEAAIILIAFIVVATVFAFSMLSAGTESTERGNEAIYAGLEGVQSSLAIRGDVIGQDTTADTNVDTVVFTLAIVSGGDPIDMTDTSGDNVMIIGYRDGTQFVNEVDWTSAWIGTNDSDTMLEDGELVEISVDLSSLGTPLSSNTEFTLEAKPPTGAVLNITRSIPASVEAVMDLR